jgi:GntR family transcriptional regulator / MocR family aminotransferase
MDWPIDRERLLKMDRGIPRYELIAEAIESAIVAGRLRSGERLSTVRELAVQLGVSGTTVAAAYNLLSEKGWIRSEVGRGTFVTGPQIGGAFVGAAKGRDGGRVMATRSPVTHGPVKAPRPADSTIVPWRRRALMSSATRLRAAYPGIADCSTGRPDPGLLPLSLLQRVWREVIDSTSHADLQYAGPEPVESLVKELLPRLASDNVPAQPADIVVGSSAQQLMVLTLQVLAAASAHSEMTVVVENPGYPTIFDTYERAGHRLVGIEVDAFGAVPASLDAALRNEANGANGANGAHGAYGAHGANGAHGAMAVLLTPRAHNPTGASWSVERAAALADVIAGHPGVLVIEDDHFAGITTARPGSLLADRRIEDRVVYIRSFSKSIAPDLRIAVAVARPRLRTLLAEAKSFADGWTSRLAQRTLARILADEELDVLLEATAAAYAQRRIAAANEVHAAFAPLGGGAWSGADGVNIWVHLPTGSESVQVIEQAASLGVLVAPGEPFFIRPGRVDVLRLNAGAVSADKAVEVGRALAKAALIRVETPTAAIPV